LHNEEHFKMKTIAAFGILVDLAAASYSCVDFNVPLSFTATRMPTTFPPFENHYQSVQFLNDFTARNAASGPSPFGPAENITVDMTVAAQYCTPKGQDPTTVQILTHGLGFDHSYWDFGGSGSQYNYIEAATAAGFATLSYDRMGNGKSTIKNPYDIQQLGPETAVLVALTTLLREGGLSKPAGCKISIPSKVFHVGHSFGSCISNALVAAAPSLSDGIVLTGFSTDSSFGVEFAISTDFHIAKENQPDRLGAYTSNGWLTWGDELGNQYSFLHYPNFSPDVLAQAEATKFPFTIGELFTAIATKAPAWDGPVLVCSDHLSMELNVFGVLLLTSVNVQITSGEYDRIFCGADCTGLLRKAKSYFPNANVSIFATAD
jgi:pimeloyl-ACP methyl ester carboxylesterase